MSSGPWTGPLWWRWGAGVWLPDYPSLSSRAGGAEAIWRRERWSFARGDVKRGIYLPWEPAPPSTLRSSTGPIDWVLDRHVHLLRRARRIRSASQERWSTSQRRQAS